MESKPHFLADSSNGASQQGSRALRILVVEDHEDTAETTAVLLRLYGCEVHLARDGPAALQQVQASQPDVVLLDLGLPKMTGWQLAEQITQLCNGRRPFLIAVTGYGMESDRLRSRQAGIDLHLVKPVHPETLEHLLRRIQTLVVPDAEPHCGNSFTNRNGTGSRTQARA